MTTFSAEDPPMQTSSPPPWAFALLATALGGAVAAVYGSTTSRQAESEARIHAEIVEIKAHQERDGGRVGALESGAARTSAQLDAIERSSARIEAAVDKLAAEIGAQKKGSR